MTLGEGKTEPTMCRSLQSLSMGNLKGFCVGLCRGRRLNRRVAPEDTASNGKSPGRRSRESRRRINHPPPPQYSAVGEKLRTSAPPALQCALFCGGARCKYEQPDHWQPHECAIQGIYSDWITDDLLAMARPSTASIAARNVVQQFHSWGIRTVINLQTAGEHASCGPPLTSSGFTYEPAIFMENDIYYYNFAWKDYGEASLSGLLDMVKVVAFSLSEGRVAVHCHAGIGRTGVLIASYLVYSLRVRANDAIRLVRKRRPRAVQTSGQILCVQQFEQYLLPQTVVFSSKELPVLTKERKTSEFTLKQHLFRQRAVLHGLEERVFRDLPKIVYCLCERLLAMCGCRESLGQDYRIRNRPFTRSFLAYRLRQAHRTDPPSPEEDTRVEGSVSALPMLEWRDPVEDETEWNLESVDRMSSRCGRAGIAAVHVYDAFVVDHSKLPEDRRRYLRDFRHDLNQREGAFDRIKEEEDPAVLTGLLLEWLEGLKCPVLDRQDLALVVAKGDAEGCIRNMQTEKVILVEYLLRFVTRLRPLCAPKRVEILKRLLASLAQQTVLVGGQALPSRDFQRLREGTCGHALNFLLRFLMELQKDMARPGSDDGDVVVPRKAVRSRAWRP